MRPAHILIVDDDREILNVLDRALTTAGFECKAVDSGVAAATHCSLRIPDAVLLDLALGDISGFMLLRALRSNTRTKAIPVVFVTGRSDADLLEDAGLATGAFAFLRKPFNLEEVTVTLRKATGDRSGDGVSPVASSTFVAGPGFRIDTAACKLHVEGRVEHLEPKERDILLVLLRRPGRLCSANFLRKHVWGTADLPYNTLETRVSVLRRKLGCLGSRLQNVRHHGYRLAV